MFYKRMFAAWNKWAWAEEKHGRNYVLVFNPDESGYVIPHGSVGGEMYALFTFVDIADLTGQLERRLAERGR